VLRFTAAGGPLVIAQPSGKPISWQTHAGESAAATVASDCTASASEFRLPCDGGAVALVPAGTVRPPVTSPTDGVGQW
jgi:hypothetical protein